MPKRVLYLDPFSGIAGDMLVGALLDLGLDLEDLKKELSKLDLSGYELRVTKVLRGGIAGSKFDVLLNGMTEDEHRRAHAQGVPHEHAPGKGKAVVLPVGSEMRHPLAGKESKEPTLYMGKHGNPKPVEDSSTGHDDFYITGVGAGLKDEYPASMFEETVISRAGKTKLEPPGQLPPHLLKTALKPATGPHGTQILQPKHAPAGKHSRAHEHAADKAGHTHAHSTFAEIKARLERSGLSARVKQQSIRAFQVLADAEGRMHHKPAEKVHFHEVGAVDSIVDFVSACAGLELLGIDELRCGPVALGGDGGGYVECAHGTLPVPAFATLELMKGLPIRPCPVKEELTTPTGAALLKALVAPEHFGPLPVLHIEKVGYGAGTRDDPHVPVPNLLRAVLGTEAPVAKPGEEVRAVLASLQAPAKAAAKAPEPVATDEADTVVEISANIDDSEPEVLGYAMEKLLAQGALDVFFTPVQMKKSRPGTLLTVIAPPEKRDELVRQVFRETTTFGVRYEVKERAKLKRATEHLKTPWGSVRVKIGTWKGELVSLHPEYDDCKTIAERENIPLRMVLDVVRAQFVHVEESKK